MSTGPKNGWGGARPNSGPKKESLSVAQVREMLETAKKYAKEKGKSIDDVLCEFIFEEKVHDQVVQNNQRIAAIKLFKEYTIAKLNEGGDIDKNLSPSTYLPEERPDPAKVVPING